MNFEFLTNLEIIKIFLTAFGFGAICSFLATKSYIYDKFDLKRK